MSSVSLIATPEKERKNRTDSRPLLHSLWLNVGEINIHCLAAGSRGRPVVILHGGGFDAAGLSFRKTIPVLAGRHRVFAPDWPGFGESDAMPRNWCVEECVEFVADLLDALGLRRVILVGLSMGGAFALGFTLRSPEHVERLVLVDSVGLGGGIPGGFVSYFALHLPLVDELRWALLKRVPNLARRSMCAPLLNQSGAAIEEALDEIIRLARKPGSGTAFRQLQRSEYRWRGLRTSYLDRLSEIQIPTLIVHGAEDKLIPVACAQRAHWLIPHSQLEIIARCGHLPPVEQPESFNRIISSFLRSRRRPVRAKISPKTGDLARDKILISHGHVFLPGGCSRSAGSIGKQLPDVTQNRHSTTMSMRFPPIGTLRRSFGVSSVFTSILPSRQWCSFVTRKAKSRLFSAANRVCRWAKGISAPKSTTTGTARLPSVPRWNIFEAKSSFRSPRQTSTDS
jgi:pimeloyl-ACP methyl ester carboxylesterase